MVFIIVKKTVCLTLTGYKYRDAEINYCQTTHTVNSKQSQYVYLKKLPFLPAVIIIKVLIKLNSAYGAASLPFSDVPKTKVIHTRHKKHSISLVFFLHKYRVHMVHTALKMTVYPETKFEYVSKGFAIKVQILSLCTIYEPQNKQYLYTTL